MTTSNQILQTLAQSNPDFSNFFSSLGPKTDAAQLPEELLTDTLAVLSEDPQQAIAINTLSQNGSLTKSFVTGSDVAVFFAVAFLMRTHIKLERTTTGKWKFLIEHKPTDSKLLTSLLKKLESWMGNSAP